MKKKNNKINIYFYTYLFILLLIGLCSFVLEADASQPPTPLGRPLRQEKAVHKRDALLAQKHTIYHKAAQFFDNNAKNLASIIAQTLSKYGTPDAYIAGREFSESFFFGVQYGNGTLVMRDGRHMDIYWHGPSLGFDIGADTAKTFILIYNLSHPSSILNKRIPSVAGNLYIVGGVSASLTKGNGLTIIPIQAGVGLRVGVDVNYIVFSRRPTWDPF